ncbi:MAG: hypothetical protein NTZ83_00180 [Candidatus Pacearchaeota archaeon]|nr:hypothetical protein [Candidatus Pacearchaeota archaeon]
MEDNKESLEERAKRLLKSKITGNYKKIGYDPLDIKNLKENPNEIDYLVEKRYIIERGDTVGSFCYIPTPVGRKWALS